MRISDWSSDVCSSDLQAVKHLCAEMLERAESATAVAWDAASAHAVGGEQLRLAARVAGAVEIGRASCRERVSQYVSLSVFAVTLKQKTTYTTRVLTE